MAGLASASVKRKVAVPVLSAEKRIRPNTSHTLGELRDGLERFTDVFAAVGSGRSIGLDATPVRKNKAVQRMEKLEGALDDGQKLDLMDLFTKDVAMADAYLAIESEGLRKRWIDRRLSEAL